MPSHPLFKPLVDIRARIYDMQHEDGDPLGEPYKVWRVYAPRLDDYLTRALDPTAAPAYGVPDDR